MQRNSIPVMTDHAYQSMEFQTINRLGFVEQSVAAGTWNLQNKCHSKKSNRGLYSNNPYDVDESFEQYQSRKCYQINMIEKNIMNNGDDIVFLQEIDFLKDEKGPHKYLRAEFEDRLKKHGFSLDVTQKPKADGYSQQPLAIVYNARKFVLESSQGVFPSTEKTGKHPQFRGYESTFRFKSRPSKKLIATNLHLIYGHDYRDEIERYQISQEKTGHLCIMGGDTNNIQQGHLYTSMGSFMTATNFSRDETTQKLTIEHEKKGDAAHTMKSYDRFFAVPSYGCYLRAVPTFRSQHVIIDDKDQAIFLLVNAEQCKLMCSRIGERWRQPVDVMSELEKTYQQAHTRASQKAILHEMHAYIQFQGLSIDFIRDTHIRNAYDRYYNPFFHQHATEAYYEHYLFDYYPTYVPHVDQAPSESLPPAVRNSRVLELLFRQIVMCQTLDQFNQTLQHLHKSGHCTFSEESELQTHSVFSSRISSARSAFQLLCRDKEKQLRSQQLVLSVQFF